MGGQCMPVGHKKQAFILGLQPNPVLQNSVVVPQVQGPGGPHAR